MSILASNLFPDYPCSCENDQPECTCDQEERAIRRYAYGLTNDPMTDQQREYCFAQVLKYSGVAVISDMRDMPDAMLARAVLKAWSM